MFLKLFFAFSIIPIAEIYILIKIGSYFGVITSILLVVITGFLGAYLAKIQGLNTLFRIQESLQEGRLPSSELIDAVLILFAGFLLLTPGFLTDFLGFLLLIQITRNLVKLLFQKIFRKKFYSNFPEDNIIEH